MPVHTYDRLDRYTVAMKVIDIFGNNSMTLGPMNAEKKRCLDTENKMNRKEITLTTQLAEPRDKADEIVYVH